MNSLSFETPNTNVTHKEKRPTAEIMDAAAREFSIPADHVGEILHKLGCERLEKGKLKKAVKLIQQAAESGELKAAIQLVRLYKKGKGGERDATKASAWALKAVELHAAQGNQLDPEDALKFGKFYEKGLGVERNESKALELFQEAATYRRSSAEKIESTAIAYLKLPEARATYKLANLYATGEKVKNAKRSADWYHYLTLEELKRSPESAGAWGLTDLYSKGQAVPYDEAKSDQYNKLSLDIGL